MTTAALQSLARISTRCSTLQHIKISIKECVHSSIMQNCNCICCSWKVLWLLNKYHQLLIRQRWILVGRTAWQDKWRRQRDIGGEKGEGGRGEALKYCTFKRTKPHPHGPNWAKVKACPSFCVSSPNKLTRFCLFTYLLNTFITDLFNGAVNTLLVLTPHLSFVALISSYSLNLASTTETVPGSHSKAGIE